MKFAVSSQISQRLDCLRSDKCKLCRQPLADDGEWHFGLGLVLMPR